MPNTMVSEPEYIEVEKVIEIIKDNTPILVNNGTAMKYTEQAIRAAVATNMVGKTFKSKNNGRVFDVVDLKFERGKKYYVMRDIKTGYTAQAEKGEFEKEIMQILEEVSK